MKRVRTPSPCSKAQRGSATAFRAPHAGFTLLEVILAMGLSAVLLLAIYQASALHFFQLEAGRFEVNQGQILRGLVRLFRRDLSATFTDFVPQGTASAEDAGMQVEAEFDVPAGGVRGYADTISLAVHTSLADADHAATADSQQARSDVCIVRYWLSMDEGNQGLYRDVIHRLPDSESNADPMRFGESRHLTSQVRELAFRYYDGIDWIEEWDSTNAVAPNAVEVTFAIPRLLTNAGSPESLEYHRLVVSLPPPAPSSSSGGSSSGEQGQSGSSGTGGTP